MSKSDNSLWVLLIDSELLGETQTLLFATEKLARDALLDSYEEEQEQGYTKEFDGNPTVDELRSGERNSFTAVHSSDGDNYIQYSIYEQEVGGSAKDNEQPPESITVSTRLGDLRAGESADPQNKGIYIEFIPKGKACAIDTVVVEVPEKEEQVSIYTYDDPHSEEWQHKHVMLNEDIEEALKE